MIDGGGLYYRGRDVVDLAEEKSIEEVAALIWTDDEAMGEYRDALEQYEPRANPADPNCVYGWSAAATMVEALKGIEAK
jgi:citrate synthase